MRIVKLDALLADIDDIGTRMSEGKKPRVYDYKVARAAAAMIRLLCTCPVCNKVDLDGLEACSECYNGGSR